MNKWIFFKGNLILCFDDAREILCYKNVNNGCQHFKIYKKLRITDAMNET